MSPAPDASKRRAVLYLRFTYIFLFEQDCRLTGKSRVFIPFSQEAYGARGLVSSPTFHSRGT